MLDCEDIVKQALGRDMTDDEIRDFIRQGKRLKRELDARNALNQNAADLQKAAQDWARREQFAALQRKVNTHRNILARTKTLEHCLTDFKGMEAEGLYSLLVGSRYLRDSGRMSVDAMQTGLSGHYVGSLLHDLEALSRQHLDMLGDARMGREIAEAMFAIPKGRQAFNGSDIAWEIGEVIHKWSEQARMDANRAGAWIAPIDGYIVQQTHDSARVAKAGYQKWRDYIEPRLDWDRIHEGAYADPAKAAEKEKFLEETFKSISTGLHKAEHSKQANDLVRPSVMGSEASRVSKHRVLHFKSGGDWFDYNVNYGHGRFSEAVIHGFQSAGESTGLMRVLGPSPQATLQWVQEELEVILRNRGDIKGARKLKNMRGIIEDAMKEVDGTLNIEGNATLAAVSRNVRAIQSMAKLGGAVISSLADLPNFAMEMAYQGRNPFGAMLDGLSYMLKGKTTLDQKRVLSQCGVFFDGMVGSVAARFSGNDRVAGKMAAAMNTFFKYNGLSIWTDLWKRNACLVVAHDMAQLRNHGWNQLAKQRKRLLSQYGIDEARWDLLRKGATTAADGREYLTPEAARSLSDSDLGAYLQKAGRQDTEYARDSLRTELEDQYRSMIRDRVQYAVLEPDAKNKRILRRGISSGTLVGETLRFVTQFKSFPLLMVTRPMFREIFGTGNNSLGWGLAKSLNPVAAFIPGAEGGSLFQLMAAMTVMGYLSMTTKQILANKTPQDPRDRKTIMAAFTQGGGAGIFGDFLTGSRSRMGNTLMGTLAGPTLGDVGKLSEMLFKIRDGEFDQAQDFMRMVVGHIPGNNIFYVNGALNYLLLNSFYEMMSPGYLQRAARRIRKENGQTFLIDPYKLKLFGDKSRRVPMY